MTIPSIRTLHGIVRISVVLLLVIAVVAGPARANLPREATNAGAFGHLSAEAVLSPDENDREAAGTSLICASVQLVLFGVDTFLDLRRQEVSGDSKVAAAD